MELKEELKETLRAIGDTARLMYSVAPQWVIAVAAALIYLMGTIMPAWTGLIAVGVMVMSGFRFSAALHRAAEKERRGENE